MRSLLVLRLSNEMKRLLIIYHSQSGTTAQLAQSVWQGACADGDVEVKLLRAMAAGSEDLRHCDAVIFGSPENLGYLSGGMKDFFDRTFYPLQPHQINIPYGLFISAGNDGSQAAAQLQRIARGYPMRLVAEPLIFRGEYEPRHADQCHELGQTIAAGLAIGIF